MNPISTPLETQVFLAARSYLYGGTMPWTNLDPDPYAPRPARLRAERRSRGWVRAAFGRRAQVAAAGPCG
jgi:hypothetical protein